MKTIIFILPLFCFMSLACSKQDDDKKTPQDLLVKLSVPAGYVPVGELGWAMLSDIDGNVLACKFLQNGTVLDMQNEIPYYGNGYHLTLVKEWVVPSQDWGYPEFQNVNLETFAFIQKENLSLVKKEPEQTQGLYPKAYVKLNVNDGTLENYVAGSTLVAYQGDTWSNGDTIPVGMKRNNGDVYVIIKMVGEAGWRHAFFEEVAAETILNVNTSDMAKVPASTVQVPLDFVPDMRIHGIRNCDKTESLSLQWYTYTNNGVMPARYSTGIFDKYRTVVRLSRQQEQFEFIKMGSPITEYLPSPHGFIVNQQDIQSFELSHDDDFTVFEADWWFEKPALDIHKTVRWKVWGAFPSTFKAPEIPACILDVIYWLKTSDMELISVKKEKYSSFTDYESFMDYYLQNPQTGTDCDQYDFNGDGSLETKTKYFQ